MPPVGQNLRFGKGAAIALRKAVPPAASAGKSFTTEKPRLASVMASDTVAQPGNDGSGTRASAAASSADVPGLTRNFAPADKASRISGTSLTVPIPTTACGTSAAILLAASTATGVRSVTS